MLDYLKSLWYSLLTVFGIYKFENKTVPCTKEIKETGTEVSDLDNNDTPIVNKQLRNGRKLTCSEVVEIIKIHVNGGITNNELAKKYGVSASTISRIVTKKTYKHCH